MLNPALKVTSKSMLSFDLRRDSGQMEKNVQDELVVIRGSGKRRSSGRHTLQSYISKKLAYQAGTSALIKREVPAKSTVKGSESVPSTGTNRRFAKKSLPLASTTTERSRMPSRETSQSCRTTDFELPLGQEFDDAEVPSSSVKVSQTQLYNSPGKFTPSKLQSPLPFLATPPTVQVREPVSRIRGLSPLIEEGSDTTESSDESEEAPITKSISRPKPCIKKPVKSLFLDIEASESSDGGRGSGDEGDESDGSDVSGLIASGTIESDEEDVHRKLHVQWEMEQEKNAAIARIGTSREDTSPTRRERKQLDQKTEINKPVVANAHAPLRKRTIPKKVHGEKVIEKKIPVVPLSHFVTRKPNFSTRNRRSSVSMSSDIEVKVIPSCSISRPRPTGNFSFIQPPSADVSRAAQERQEKNQSMRDKAQAPQKLNGAKRFVFGNPNSKGIV